MAVFGKIGRLLGGRGWPSRVPPTVPGGGAPAFHCPECRQPAPDGHSTCPSCGAHLLGDLA